MKITKLAVATTCLLCGATAWAGPQDIKASNNQFSIDAISTNVNYTETGNGRLGTNLGTLDTEKGNVAGVGVSLSLMRDWWLGNDYLQINFSRNSGNTDYVGALQSGGAYGSVVGTSTATITDYSVRLGKGNLLSNNLMLTPFVELGHHRWQRGVNAGETYTNSYAGIGALLQFSPVQRLVLSANALAGQTFSSNIDVAGSNRFSGPLGNSSLVRVGVAADYAFTPQLHGNVGIDYSAFSYGISDIYLSGGSYTWEPDSKTKLTTVRVGLGYAF